MLFDFSQIQKDLKYEFKNPKLLDKALTHRSYSAERKLPYSNERLELLGDSVITLVVIEYLIKKFPNKDEGYLSKIKSHIVSSKNLFKWAKKLSVEKYIKLSSSEMKSGGREKMQIISNTFEAIIGAVYLDGGLEPVKNIIYTLLGEEKEFSFDDHKSQLQELCQKRLKIIPKYYLISQEGPEHRKKFKVSVVINNNLIATGEGYSKKEAENNAAKSALERMKEGVI